MLNRQLYEDFFITFLKEDEYKDLQRYFENIYQIKYWENFSDKERSATNISVLTKQNEELKPKLNKLLSEKKTLQNSFQIQGNIFHQLVFLKHTAETLPPGSLEKPKGLNPYSIATYKALIQLLLSLDIDPNNKDSVFNQSPLSAAIGFDNEAFTLALLFFSDHINLNDTSHEKWTASSPLLLAIQRGRSNLAIELIKKGADLNLADKNGLTPLHWSMIMADENTMDELVKHKNIENKKALNGKFPIDYLNIKTDELEMPSRQGILFPNETNAPELRPIVAHFWNDRAAFFKYRNDRYSALERCKYLLNSLNKTTHYDEKKLPLSAIKTVRHDWPDKDLLAYRDLQVVISNLVRKEDQTSGYIINLIEVLDTVESNTDVILAIGSGQAGPKSWQTNLNINDSQKKIIINFDPDFQYSKEYQNTDDVRYFPLHFNSTIVEIIEPLIRKILAESSNNLALCDFRDPALHIDCANILNRYISHFRNPDSHEGNLYFLQGYFSDMPVFWPTQDTIKEESTKAVNEGCSVSCIYSKLISKMHNSPERRATSSQSFDFFFEENSTLNCDGKGICFMYPQFGSLNNVQKELFRLVIKENASHEIQESLDEIIANSPRKDGTTITFPKVVTDIIIDKVDTDIAFSPKLFAKHEMKNKKDNITQKDNVVENKEHKKKN